MREQIALQSLLRRRLSELQKRNPAFSVRAFAIRLGLQPAATNEILKGQRRVSRKMAEKIAARLQLDPTERASLLKDFPLRREAKSPAAANEYLKLSADQFQIVSDWAHFAILNLIQTRGFRADVAWIAERLAITEPRTRAAIERLDRLGLIERGPKGEWKRAYASVQTTDDLLDVSIQKSHLEDLDLARASMLRDPVELRDFTSLTIPVSPSLLPKAKEAIRRAQDEIADLLASEPSTEVYRFTSYLFPLSGRKKNA